MSALGADTGSAKRRIRIIVAVVLGLVALAVTAVAVPLVVTGSPEFFSRYHLLERRYVNLQGSAHEGIGCRGCHETDAVRNGLALVGDFYTSYVSTSAVPANFRFGPPTNDRCLTCHEEDWSDDAARTSRIPHPAHQRVATEERECVGCHKWTAHFETYMTKHKEMPFSGVCVSYGCHVGTKVTEQCFDCHHVLHESGEKWRTEHPTVIAKTGEAMCTESCHTVQQCQQCHTTGVRPEFEGLPIEISMKSIEKLHVKPEWTAEYHGAEALKGQDRCMKCHQTVGECDECHRQRPAFHGSTKTWIGRHSKQTEDVADPRCIACHEKAWCEDCHDQFEEME